MLFLKDESSEKCNVDNQAFEQVLYGTYLTLYSTIAENNAERAAGYKKVCTAWFMKL